MTLRRIAAPLGAVVLAAFAAAGCDEGPTSKTAYNNTGNSASPEPARLPPSTAVAPPTGDTASPQAPALASSSNGVQGGNRNSALSETATTGKVKAAIAADSLLKDSDISVATEAGVVTLSGKVKSRDQATAALQLAQRQEGVARVQNELTVE